MPAGMVVEGFVEDLAIDEAVGVVTGEEIVVIAEAVGVVAIAAVDADVAAMVTRENGFP
jgi:hypothetical protein